MSRYFKILFIPIVIFAIACDRSNEFSIDKSYLEGWHEWKNDREQWIKERYLKIFLMEQLDRGINTVGNAGSNSIVISKDAFPSEFGEFHVGADTVSFVGFYEVQTSNATKIKPESKYVIYQNERTDTLHFADFSFFIFRDQNKFYVRFRDNYNPASLDFIPSETFPANREMIFWSDFIEDSQTLNTPMSESGSVKEEYSGYLSFTYMGDDYRLHVKNSQLEFGDQTNGETTYGGGRYLIVDLDSDPVLLDFNRSYSPPCAFSPHTICPLPPPENILPFKVEAGQKYE